MISIESKTQLLDEVEKMFIMVKVKIQIKTKWMGNNKSTITGRERDLIQPDESEYEVIQLIAIQI